MSVSFLARSAHQSTMLLQRGIALKASAMAALIVLGLFALPSYAAEGERLQGRIEAALLLSEPLNGYVFEVSVTGSDIVVRGEVTDLAHQRMVEQVVTSMSDDHTLTNEVRVAVAQPTTDGSLQNQRAMLQSWQRAQLEATLRREFAESSALDGLNIDIDIQNDTLILSGTVSSELERMVANQLGQNLSSIQVVNNQLVVEE
ncbi:MAG: BON domain-containing protein [Natronospirillum sp.]